MNPQIFTERSWILLYALFFAIGLTLLPISALSFGSYNFCLPATGNTAGSGTAGVFFLLPVSSDETDRSAQEASALSVENLTENYDLDGSAMAELSEELAAGQAEVEANLKCPDYCVTGPRTSSFEPANPQDTWARGCIYLGAINPLTGEYDPTVEPDWAATLFGCVMAITGQGLGIGQERAEQICAAFMLGVEPTDNSRFFEDHDEDGDGEVDESARAGLSFCAASVNVWQALTTTLWCRNRHRMPFSFGGEITDRALNPEGGTTPPHPPYGTTTGGAPSGTGGTTISPER